MRNSQERLVRNDRALSDPGDTIHFVSSTLEETMPVLVKDDQPQDKTQTEKDRNHDSCSAPHASIGETVGHVDLRETRQWC